MVKLLSILSICLVVALIHVGELQAPTPAPLPAPIQRAQAALEGLMKYYLQAERNGKPAARPKKCPCFTCDKKNCTPPECLYCKEGGCPTAASTGCYTKAEYECVCNDPPGPLPPGVNTAASFYFSCGQMGGFAPYGGSGSVYTCGCESDWLYSCTNCYRWWSASALEASINYCMATGQSPNSTGICGKVHQIAESMWIHSPYNAHWDARIKQVFVDDFSWYALAYLRVYDWTGQDVWRNRSMQLHDWAFKWGWDHAMRADINQSCGGFWWNMEDPLHFKDSISIVEMLHVAGKLAAVAKTPAEHSRFIATAEEIWNWLFAFDNGRGLLAENGIMSTGAVPQYCCHALSASREKNITYPRVECANSRVAGMSYNHGILMSSAALLYNITADKNYLQTAISLLESALVNLTDVTGAMLDIQRGSRAAAYGCGEGDPGSDFFSFKGIFVMHLGYFVHILQESNALTPDVASSVHTFLQLNSNNVWTKALVKPPFTNATDYCALYESGKAAKNQTFPKFHWWWTHSNGSVQTPPDTRLWFTNSALGCNYAYHNSTNNTNTTNPQWEAYIWVGFMSSPDLCRDLCANRSDCTKYVYHNGQEATCDCFTCEGKPCHAPRCQYCARKSKKACPHKSSKGCYTTSTAACTCTGPGPKVTGNCFLYRLTTVGNRTAMAACTKTGDSTMYTMGIKRPPEPSLISIRNPASSCRGRCGNTSSTVRNGTRLLNISCQCDAACSRHLDCCLDYVEECLPPEKQDATCRGMCRYHKRKPSALDNQAIPLRGGGYCYCDGTCLNWFTDNNSLGSCCADYFEQCAETVRDPVCLDPRSQTQALQLFVSHHVVQNITNNL
eukprot:scpid38547/ scgid1535/ Mannan endo-1,6-alpha-mannosidase DCW1; Defective cell wall 1; Endo-alpha-1-&gt